MILEVISRCILFATGWRFNTPEKISQRVVAVIWPHESYFESFILLLVNWSIRRSTNMPPLVTLTTKWLFKNPLGRGFASLFGGVSATSVTTKNGGQTAVLIETLNSMDRFLFTIAPNGKIGGDTWRTGWKVIAKETNAEIYHVHVDFSEHTVNIHRTIDCDAIQDVPCIETSIKMCGKPEKILSYIDNPMMSSVISSIIMLGVASYRDYILFCTVLVESFLSCMYHYSRESMFRKADVIGAYLSSAVILARLSHLGFGEYKWQGFAVFALGLVFYRCGCPRSNGRNANYKRMHSLFHVVGGIGVALLMY